MLRGLKVRDRLVRAACWTVAFTTWFASHFPSVADETTSVVIEVDERQQDGDVPAAAERRHREQGLNAKQPYPEARLHKDWIYQDHGLDYRVCFTDTGSAAREQRMVERVLIELEPEGGDVRRVRHELTRLVSGDVPGADPRWRTLYLRACRLRRQARLAVLRSHAEHIVFTKHYFLSGVVHYAWTDHITDEHLPRPTCI
jgi:hypothetical protein